MKLNNILKSTTAVITIGMLFTGCVPKPTPPPTTTTSTSGQINTIAGNGTPGFTSDGIQATASELYAPAAVAIDAAGNIYIADSYNNRIRKVSSSGIITTIAGNGSAGFSGDGTAATSAQLNTPYGVAVDGSGNVYIADQNNLRIRMVNISGIITTVAGGGTAGINDGGPATAAMLSAPDYVAVDASGNIYIADQDNFRIRKVNTSGVISTIAGGGTATPGDGGPATAAQLNFPSGVAVDEAGNVYIADNSDQRVRKVNTSGIISTIAGNGNPGFSGDGGAATNATLSSPTVVTLDASGNIYIADAQNMRIRKVNTSGIISTIAGTGLVGFSGDGEAATIAAIQHPEGIVVDASGNIYIGDYGNNRVRKVNK